MHDSLTDKLLIRELVERWAVWRDAGDWERFDHDFITRHEGRWKVLHRQPIYEKDRIDPVDPCAQLRLDQELLASMPEGYRHLAYIQTRLGYQVKTDMPMLKGEQVQALFRRGASWLAGGPLER